MNVDVKAFLIVDFMRIGTIQIHRKLQHLIDI